jgi:acyl-coenzyme A synthetase/AMP-(fatty) acid ligase
VLTGRETVAATFAATAHLHRDRPAAIEVAVDGTRRTTTWADVVRTVRHAAVALAGEGLGDGASVALEPGAPAPHRAVVLLVAAATGAVVAGGRGHGPRPRIAGRRRVGDRRPAPGPLRGAGGGP